MWSLYFFMESFYRIKFRFCCKSISVISRFGSLHYYSHRHYWAVSHNYLQPARSPADFNGKLEISFDSTLCSGCPVALHATPGFLNYYWYRNDTLLDEGSSTFIAVESGIYTVQVNSFCDMVSDPIDLTLPGYSRIKGHVFLDKDSDCVFNNADINLDFYGPTPFLVKLERQNYSVIVNTDSSGNYDLPIDTGNFRISLLNPSNLLEYSCPDSGAIHVYIPNFGDTISGNDFGLKTKYSCNRLRVVTTSSAFRPCSNSTISVTCFNEGSEVENNPVVNLRLATSHHYFLSLFSQIMFISFHCHLY